MMTTGQWLFLYALAWLILPVSFYMLTRRVLRWLSSWRFAKRWLADLDEFTVPESWRRQVAETPDYVVQHEPWLADGSFCTCPECQGRHA